MTVLKTRIPWTDTTVNPTWGCTKISAGCDNCYAEAINTHRARVPFEEIRTFPKRLDEIRRLKPLLKDGRIVPRMVFLNSTSDIFHERIDPAFRGKVFDAMEANPTTIFQLLTKRPGVAQRFLRARYGALGKAPAHLWLGVSIENNDVKKRIDVLRDITRRHGVSCAFLSVEPLIGPIDTCDFTGMNWVLIGGESGARCRPMHTDWLRSAIAKAQQADAAIWFKQFGHPRNNPVIAKIMADERVTQTAAISLAAARGLELAADEKGGATLDGKLYRELPRAWHDLNAALVLDGDATKPSAVAAQNKM